MAVSDDVKARINELVAQVPSFLRTDEYGRVANEDVYGRCIGWIAAALSITQIACQGSPRSAYLKQVTKIQEEDHGYAVSQAVLSIVEVLKQLLVDLDRGLLVDFARRISAETFDDLLDHAEAYLGENRKEPAGVIVGVVFEDTIHRLCEANGIDHRDKTLDPLISALKSADHLTKLEAKEAVTAAGLRTSATHARWDEFKDDQVKSVIAFTRRLLREKLTA